MHVYGELTLVNEDFCIMNLGDACLLLMALDAVESGVLELFVE